MRQAALADIQFPNLAREDINIKTLTFSHTQKILLAFAVGALIALTLLALPVSNAQAQTGGQGKVEGQIVNATKDAKPGTTANLAVTLVSFSQSTTQMVTTTVKSDANGKFAFANLDVVTTTRHVVTTNYNGVDYFSDVLAFTSPASITLPAQIAIFETTNDASVVQVAQTHLVMDVQAPWFEIQQIVMLENTSDRVYVGDPKGGPHRGTLLLPVLPRAINVVFDDQTIDGTTLRGDEVLTYTLPIGPGKDQIVYTYAVPFTPPAFEFAMKLLADTGKLGVYMVDVGQAAQSAQLQPAPSPMGNVPGAPKFISIAGEKLAAGTVVKVAINNLPNALAQPGAQPSAPAGKTNPAPTALPLPVDNTQLVGIAVLAGVVIAGLALIGYPLLKRRQDQMAEDEADQEETPEPVTPDQARMELLQQIADLDDEFEAGKITETEYKKRRAAVKAKLVEMKV